MLVSRRATNILLVLILAVGIGIVAMLAARASGGPLDPPGTPASTGTSLEQLPGTWSRTLVADDGAPGPNPPAGCNSTRFACVLGNAAVLDRETGLVWQQAPSVTTTTWHLAMRACMGDGTGGRMGWRLASLEELRSLLDSTGLPTGNPFVGGTFWTSTTVSDVTTSAYVVNTANPTATFTAIKGTDNRRYWCVRGDAGYDGY